mgnify:CR=1 FL=1
MRTKITLAIVAALVAVGGWWYFSQSNSGRAPIGEVSAAKIFSEPAAGSQISAAATIPEVPPGTRISIVLVSTPSTRIDGDLILALRENDHNGPLITIDGAQAGRLKRPGDRVQARITDTKVCYIDLVESLPEKDARDINKVRLEYFCEKRVRNH